MANCGACDLGKTHFCADKGTIFWAPGTIKPWRDQRVPSEHHSHDIVPWAVEEKCRCGYPASHKVVEDGINPQLHPLTAYVCCKHFWGFCQNTKVIMKTMDESHTRGAETLDEVPEHIKRKYQLHEDYADGHTYDRT